ncbi:MAG: Ig-like domain-containing protein [Aureliella sp.]
MQTFLPDGYRLDSQQWLYPAIFLVVVVLIPAIWTYSRRMTAWATAALMLKTAAVLAIAFCVVQPTQRVETPVPGANVLALALDNSQSMQIKPSGNLPSRIARIRDSLQTDAPWQIRLGQDFDVRRYAFDSALSSVDNLAILESDGTASSLAATLSTIRDRFSQRPVAGVVLFSDGIATDNANNLGDLPFPVYPVVDDAPIPACDIAVKDASATVSSFELAPAAIEATVVADQLSGQPIVVRLMDEQGRPKEQRQLTPDSDQWSKKVRFRYRPPEPGTAFVKLVASLKSETYDDRQLQSRVEATTRNNVQHIAITRTPGPYKVLYVSGRPNWELKFLRRALEEDVELELKALVRIAKEEPKFSFRDTAIQEVNPLIAGFSEDEETAEKYDEPVLLRLGVDEDELVTGFPKQAEDLFPYHGVILDDVEAAFFTQQQLALLRDFVANRGGGLMMLGGVDTFHAGGYSDSPISDILPVYIDRRASDDEDPPIAELSLSRIGAQQPWLRLRREASDDKGRLAKIPEISTYSQFKRIKPGASTFAQLDSTAGVLPGLVGQRFGKGRTLALAVGDFWHWSLRREKTEEDDLAQLWRQITRFLTNDAPRRVQVDVTPPSSTGDPHLVRVTVRDESFGAADNVEVSLQVTDPNGDTVELVAVPDDSAAGQYIVEYWSTIDGGYRCTASAKTLDGEVLPEGEAGWTAQTSASEFARVAEDRALLESVAEQSGGKLVPVSELEEFAASLPSRKVPITEVRWKPLWHQPWLLALAIACLCTEWGLRRWKGLA